ncbi:MAG: PGPGW domain-containing protein [Desulfuromonadaceae bacterium]|nr:PGPGW domain-containing protein [Desulfuromonadaceae bacterium]
MKHLVLKTVAQAKRLIVVVAGFTILIVGVAMIVLPGPAFVVIPIGLAILATEFIWARKLLDTVKERITRMRKRRGAAMAGCRKENVTHDSLAP